MEEEIDYAITELFKDMQDEELQNKLSKKQETLETLAKEEFSFDEELIYSNQLGGCEVDFGLSYRYMLLCSIAYKADTKLSVYRWNSKTHNLKMLQ